MSSPFTPELASQSPRFNRLINVISEKQKTVSVSTLTAAKPFLIASLYRVAKRPLLVIEPFPEKVKQLQEELEFWRLPDARTLTFPEPDTLPYEQVTPDPSLLQQRINVLYTLSARNSSPVKSSAPPCIVTSVSSLMRKIVNHSFLAGSLMDIRTGMDFEPMQLIEKLVGNGYVSEQTVEVPGTLARRGGIVDIFSPNYEKPLRLEFNGNRIESIRFFEPSTQRSISRTDSPVIIPPDEFFSQDFKSSGFTRPDLPVNDTLLDYLPDDILFVLDSPQDIITQSRELTGQWDALREQKIAENKLPPGTSVPYLIAAELESKLGEAGQSVLLVNWPTNKIGQDDILAMDFAQAPSYASQLDSFLEDTVNLARKGNRIFIISQQSSRLSELYRERDVGAPVIDKQDIMLTQAPIVITHGSLPSGWRIQTESPPGQPETANDIYLFTDNELFGVVKQQRYSNKRPVKLQSQLSGITIGDYVVHVDHGIGKFTGMRRMSVNGGEQDYLVIQYQNEDKLYVPSDQVDRLSRYVGSSGTSPALSRLGTQEWSRVKQKVKEAARERAQELLALYAARQVSEGFLFDRDSVWQQELEASFPYVETPDQVQAMQQIKEDMENPRPMDRLICGDVGYGKTELALRAAFKAVISCKQVAFLVPTTVLAEQHYNTFTQRLSVFPVTVEVLSRFRSGKEQQQVLEGLAGGSVDICIGTHRLLQKDVVFKDLGLVIIDEEQRFGVVHKEYFKQIRKEIDVLTLSATPIPRTLHMSMVGIRDMSVMETPPEDRLPVKTSVSEYDPALIREAILKELERNGQVFFVHNRVATIFEFSERLKQLIPEASIAFAHGQMPEDKLESVMLSFSEGKVDVLVCTTIIESGLDIPNANTLIVNQADRLGLAQLYQLRGRVGRGSNRAYAYFFHNKGKILTPNAIRRLETIFESTELGAGFQIAAKDLEIRGAGNLLGVEQSGSINSVGFELYCRLMAEAVEEIKGKQAGKELLPRPEQVTTSVNLPLEAFIPEHYVKDVRSRIDIYLKMARTGSIEGINQIKDELADRYGPFPEEVNNLFYLVRIKLLGMRAGLKSIYSRNGQVIFESAAPLKVNPSELKKLYRHRINIWNEKIVLDTGENKKYLKLSLENLLNNLVQVV